ncbi:Transcriptional regulator GlxA family, contains an amidase domain and an AraC-type DNA-binding HTH domain [Sphingomonas sp. NFR04]|uniref:GlxA family transcriptional regulator n=1 Tax=Sphingomonas sp. NFR04 TaxID=1566283 RepID=UPI0008E0AC2A|nr:helix-turn-helix domain-containing protein [Sphingomonas sp. NFR04]SFK58832.1 Transcriptional regulator GlxA family, contains an amidase domain and an AraC-type DNA-binding HTH domain [Sphingomonas sp. NFR04]
MVDVTILALPGAFASGVAAALDIMATAARLAPSCGCGPIRCNVVSSHPMVTLSNGVKIEATALAQSDQTSDHSIWFVAGLETDSVESAAARMSEPDAVTAAEAIHLHGARGGTVACACSAVLLLERAGLLRGRRATTTWWLGEYLQRLQPDCVVDVEQTVIVDGNIVTAGAAFAHLDLMLHLLRTHFPPALAKAVAKAMILDGRQLEAPRPAVRASAGRLDLVSKVAASFEAALPDPPTITQLAAELGMSGRTLSRRIKRETGGNVSAILQSVRLHRARQLLQDRGLSIEQVAAELGYADATSLRRMMRKLAHATPGQFRPRLA